MSPLVSVILPTFNRSELLYLACQSVLSQSYRNLELIVVDDASTEDLQPVIDRLEDDRVRMLRHERNRGAAAARNTGIADAKGAFIAFQDSDDLWLPGKLERQVKMFETLPESVGVVIGSKILYGRDASWRYGPGKVTCAPPPAGKVSLDEDQVAVFLMRNRLSEQNALFRRDVFPDHNWHDPCAKANVDWEMAIRLALRTKIYEDIEPVVLSFIQGDSISKKPRKRLLGALRIVKKHRALLKEHPKAHTLHFCYVSSLLTATGKKKWARQFALQSIEVDRFALKPYLTLAKVYLREYLKPSDSRSA